MNRSSTLTNLPRRNRDHPSNRFMGFSETGALYSHFDVDHELPVTAADTHLAAGRFVKSKIFPQGAERITAYVAGSTWRLKPSHTDVEAFSSANESTEKLSYRWRSPFSHIIRELGRFKDGWAGEASRAPSDAIIRNIQATVAFLPVGTKEPEAEVEPDDGAVSISWTNTGKTASFSLTFFPSGKVGGAYASLEGGSLPGWICGIGDQRKLNAHLNEARVSQLICG